MSTFVKFCPTCRKMFRDAGAYSEHTATCGKPPTHEESVEVQKSGGDEQTLPPDEQESSDSEVVPDTPTKRPPGRPPKSR